MATLARHTLQELAVHDVVQGVTLRDLEVTPGQLRTMLAREHLVPAYKDIFFTSDRPVREGRWLAAVLHCGDDALLSHQPAGVLWRLLDDWDGWPHVTVDHRRVTKPPAGIRVHRSRRADVGARRDGIPVTSLFRTIDDLSRRLSEAALKSVVGRAERHHAIDLASLYEHATSRRLRRVLAVYVAGRGFTDSELEARFFDVSVQSRLGRPESQRRHPGGRVDFHYPRFNLIVEVDGYGSHRGKVAFHEDRRRDRANRRAGLDTLRFTWDDVVLDPNGVLDDLDHAACVAQTSS